MQNNDLPVSTPVNKINFINRSTQEYKSPPELKIVPFEQLKPAVMVWHFDTNGVLNLPIFFELCPTTYVDTSKCRYKSAKLELPLSTPGAILSMRCGKFTKGVVRTLKPGRPFEHSISLDMSVKVKNVAIKVSPRTCHITGITSNEIGLEACETIVTIINNLHSQLQWLQKNPTKAAEIREIVLQATMGAPVDRYQKEKLSERIYLQRFWKKDHMLKKVDLSTLVAENDDCINFYKLLLHHAKDFTYHGDYSDKLDWIFQQEQLYVLPEDCPQKELIVAQIHKDMVNYNIKLGFPLDRIALVKHLDGYNGMFARFDNETAYSAVIEVPNVEEPGKPLRRTRKKTSLPCTRVTCHRHGSVTFSGSDENRIEPVYYNFLEAVSDVLYNIISEYPRKNPPNVYFDENIKAYYQEHGRPQVYAE